MVTAPTSNGTEAGAIRSTPVGSAYRPKPRRGFSRALLVHLSPPLRVTSDELLGLKQVQEEESPKAARLLKRMQKIAELPPADQRILLRLLDALRESCLRTNRPRSKVRAAV